MPGTTEKRAILAKIESNYGVDPTPAGATDAIICRITNWQPLDVGLAGRERLALPYLGRFHSKVAIKRALIELEVELTGAAAAGTAPPWGPLLRACGMSEAISAGVSVTYAKISASFESVAIYANIDGMQQKLLGTRGTWRLVFVNEQIPVLRFRFLALYAAPTDTALPALTLTAHQQPVPMNKTNTTAIQVHSYACGLHELEIDNADSVDYVQFPGGSEQVFFTARSPVARLTLERPTIAQKDYFGAVTGDTSGNITLVHGAGAGRICTITAGQVRLTNPRFGEHRGVPTLSMDAELAPSVAGNNELSVVFT
jgi:hypothetical protein